LWLQKLGSVFKISDPEEGGSCVLIVGNEGLEVKKSFAAGEVLDEAQLDSSIVLLGRGWEEWESVFEELSSNFEPELVIDSGEGVLGGVGMVPAGSRLVSISVVTLTELGGARGIKDSAGGS